MAELKFLRMEFDQAPPLEQFEDRTIFQTRDWLTFVEHTQNAEPVIAVIEDRDRQVGRFTGLIVKKYGLRILGSPFPGWTTSYMGFNLDPSVSRSDALLALKDFAFRQLNCIHIEIMDRRIEKEDFQKAGFIFKIGTTGFEVDLSKDEDAIFNGMTPSCQRCIRKATKTGVVVEEAVDASFVDDYYSQLIDVFAKQGLTPTYSRERVRSLIECLLPTGRLLLARAKDNQGTCIATGIFPAMNDTMFFWGGASWRLHQHLRPNEAVQWFAMRYWKARGIIKYDMCGGGEYKKKYGVREIEVPWGRKSRYPVLETFRNLGKNIFALKQRALGFPRK